MAEPDVGATAAAFGRAVHDAGIPSSSERSVRFARALVLAATSDPALIYWTARAVFVSSREQVPLFDRVFAAHFLGAVTPAEADLAAETPTADQRGSEPEPAPAGETAVRVGAAEVPDADAAQGVESPAVAASAQERLAEKDFAELDEDELAAVRRLIAQLSLATPTRLSRRSRRDRHGDRLDLRATLRASTRTAGDPARQVRRRRRPTPRRLIVLCDISGSLEPYARAFLALLHSAVRGADAEAFVFATRLTRLTPLLKGASSVDLGIRRAAAAAPDWSSGTLIGEALARFNDEYGRRGMAHGAVVVILSDGWDRGDPALVAREMARLRRLAYRIVWINPRKAGRDYAPLVGGMAAALPSCDAFVAGNSLQALDAVADAIAAGRSAVSGC